MDKTEEKGIYKPKPKHLCSSVGFGERVQEGAPRSLPVWMGTQLPTHSRMINLWYALHFTALKMQLSTFMNTNNAIIPTFLIFN